MISRRDFLKLAGISTAALGAGYTTGKLMDNKNASYFSVHGFIPGDEKILAGLIILFKRNVKSGAEPVIYSDDDRLRDKIYELDKSASGENFSDEGRIEYRIQTLSKNFDSDIIVSDDRNPVYSPGTDFTLAFAEIRNSLKNEKARFIFSAAYNNQGLFSGLYGRKRDLVIENEYGTAEIIKADKNYRNIQVKGPLGITEVSIINRIVKVNSSCCRHGICSQSVITMPGEIIACAPNKVLIHFEA